MPDQNPAQTLHTAAQLLRHAAQRATHGQGGRWMRGTTANRSDVVLDHPHEPTVLIETYAERLEAVNAYLTLVGPATGEAVADWLDVYATRFAIWKGPHISTELGHALQVARAILGSPS